MKMKLIPYIYTYNGRWWHGGFNRYGLLPNAWIIKEFWWILWNGEWNTAWHWPELIFGIGRDWYDGPIYHANLGVWSVSVIPGKIKDQKCQK